MKVKVIIEETISQGFEVEVTSLESAYEEVRKKYRDSELVLDNGFVTDVKVLMSDDSEWTSL